MSDKDKDGSVGGVEMEIRPLKTEADYRAAMNEIDRLFCAELGSPKGDRLDVLVTLVETYEAEHFRMSPPGPLSVKARLIIWWENLKWRIRAYFNE